MRYYKKVARRAASIKAQAKLLSHRCDEISSRWIAWVFRV